MDFRWRIELFGGLRLRNPAGEVQYCRAQKPMSLLAYLAYHQRRAHPREALIEFLWPDDDLATGRHKLSVALSVLRGQLEPEGSLDHSVLVADRSSVRLAVGSVVTDVSLFESAVQAAERSAPGPERERHLETAAALYEGELLAGFYDSWIFPEQRRLAELFMQSLRNLLESRERVGDRNSLLPIALRGLSADPLCEELHAQVMRLYLAAGQPAAAVRQFRLLEERLREDLDSTPSRAVMELADVAQAQLTEAPLDEPKPPAEQPPVPASATSPRLEPVGGAVPLNSPYYVERAVDAHFHDAVGRGDSIILLKGPRQVGKTSLLARGLDRARQSGTRAILTDFQGLNAAHLETADSLLLALAESIADDLDLDVSPRDSWEPRRGANPNFRRFFRRVVMSEDGPPLVWGMDEADRLFSCAFGSEIFGMFRSWHNERALNPAGPWSRLTLVITYATEAHLFITDVNQSPFNVGTRLTLDDLTQDQVSELNRRHGGPLRSEHEVRRFYSLVGGHPFLVRCGLYEMTLGGPEILSLDRLEEQSAGDEGIFDSHLRRILLLLGRDPALCDALREVLRGRPCPNADHFYRLRSAGVLSGESALTARPRCPLYADYLSRRLL